MLYERWTCPGGATGSSGTFESEWFLLSDVQFSVVAIVNGSGRLYERVRYTPYGRGVHHWAEDLDGDGDVNPGMSAGTDEYLVDSLDGLEIDDVGYLVECDLNRDGMIDSTDKGFVTTKGSTLARGIGLIGAQDTTGLAPDNHFGYCGYVFNWESDLYTVRFRHYAPKFGRWVERDPIGYVDGHSLYQYVSSSPARLTDSSGLCQCDPEPEVEVTPNRKQPTGERSTVFDFDTDWFTPSNVRQVDSYVELVRILKQRIADGKAGMCWTISGHGTPGTFDTEANGAGFNSLTSEAIAYIDFILSDEEKCAKIEATSPETIAEFRAIREFLDLATEHLQGGRVEFAGCDSGAGETGVALGEALARAMPGVEVTLYERKVMWFPTMFYLNSHLLYASGKGFWRTKAGTARGTSYKCPGDESSCGDAAEEPGE